jgi:hypothetical protein
MVKKYLICGVGLLLAAAAACGDRTSNPAAPSAGSLVGFNAADDAPTLKAAAPTPVSPINNVRVDDPEVVLVVTDSDTKFAEGVTLTYEFEIYMGDVRVHLSGAVPTGSGTTSYVVPVALEGDRTHQWRARAQYQGTSGPWSPLASFLMGSTEGYIRGNELYDPLINGKTIGTVHGDVTFIPGLGARLNSQLAYISYQLDQTLTEGEFSIIVTGMPANTEGGKTKLFAMAEGYSDIVTNDRRMTVEKRGDPAGVVAWRFITHDDAIDTTGSERKFVNFQENLTYFWQATWRNNFFRVLIREDQTSGVNGRTIYNFGKGFNGRAYDPDPHVIFIGAPVGRSGPLGASVDRAIIRQVWVSSRPRPTFANR